MTDVNNENNVVKSVVDEVPLRRWLEEELKDVDGKRLIIRKTTVAYAASELLQKATTLAPLSANKISLDNFIVRTQVRKDIASCVAAIVGVDMISEKLSLTIIDPSDSGAASNDEGKYMGKNLVTSITSTLPGSCALGVDEIGEFVQMEESKICHLFGLLLYQIYSNLDPFLEKNLEGDNLSLFDRSGKDKVANNDGLRLTYSTLRELGSPPNICMLVQHLAECRCDDSSRPRGAYSSLKEGSDDLRLLLLHPNRLLFTSNAFGDSLLKMNKLYGRDHEVSLMRDAFSRVCTGDRVALFVGGFSGSGKTRLVESVMSSVNECGYVLRHKFDEVSRGGPLLELIAAFDRMCLSIKSKASPEDQQNIVDRLTEIFGADLSLLRKLLPAVKGLVPSLKTFEEQRPVLDDANMNIQSVCFILNHFLRAVSSKSHPVTIFLDDLQWCNNIALDVIQHILCDESLDASCCLFVGSYRSNEVASNHIVFHLMKELEESKVCSVQKMVLDGVKCEDLNALISDALCLFPRLTRGLSSIIHEKTEGNPFFFLEFLRSLINRGLLRYSLRSEQWEWDEDLIRLEKITNNVLFLLANKMSKMRMEVQMALKVLSSFGIRVNEKIIASLNNSSQFPNILSGVEEAISDGFVSRVEEPLCFAFVHDKVREAAYSLIPEDAKSSFHLKLGEALRSISKVGSLDDTTLITIADQINHNFLALRQSSTPMRVEIANLNQLAGAAAMRRSDYEAAASYLNASLKLLPDGHWQSSYRLSLDTYIASAKVAYSRGDSERLDAALKTILTEAMSLEDKLEAYYLYVNHLHAQERGEEAHLTCQDVLCQLGEKIPDYVTPLESKTIIEETVKLTSTLTEEKMLGLKECDEKSQPVLRFMILMGTVSYFSKPELLPHLNLRNLQITLEHGLCKYSCVGLVGISIVLCNISTLPKEFARLGYKVGSIGMSLLRSHFDYSDLKSRVDHSYSYVLQHIDPFLKCAERARTGFGFGIASGDTVFAFLNANGEIRYSILGGANLPNLLSETDKYLALVGHHGNTLSRSYLLIYRETISTLIDNGENTSRINTKDQEVANEGTYLYRQYETQMFHKVLQSFWMGHHDRCFHYSEKLLEAKECGKHHRLVTLFYHGLNSFVLLRKGKYTKKSSQIYKVAHKALKEAEEMSKWNYRCKVHLIEAEKYSYQGLNKEARSSYGAAIMAARASKFVHEQGLACELSALHCQRNGDYDQARKFFSQASICYSKWGSSLKVEAVSHEIQQLNGGANDSVEEISRST